MSSKNKKYEIVKSDSIVFYGRTLYRIRALRDFITVNGGIVLKNELGGYVESESNLSQEGTCWIFDNAKVFDDAKVLDDAFVCNTAEVFENAVIRNNARVDDDARISGKAKVYGSSHISNNAKIHGNAEVMDFAEVFDNAVIYENAKIFGDSIVFGNAKVHGDSSIFGDAVVYNKTEIFGDVEVSGNTIVFGIAKIGSNQKIKSGEYMYDAVDLTTLLPKVKDLYKQALRIKMFAGKYLIDENYLNNIIKEFNKYDKARKVKENLYLVALPSESEETCELLKEINNALEEIKNILVQVLAS